jgi:maleylacetate reductase
MTNRVRSNITGSSTTIRNDQVKPCLVIYDTQLFAWMTRGDVIKGLFLILAHIVDIMYEGHVSPLSLLAARECLRVAIRILLRYAQGQDTPPDVSDLLYITYLCGECWNREQTYLHHFLVDLLHIDYGLSYEDSHIALLAYTSWYNQSALSIALCEELGCCDIPSFIYDMQYKLLPERVTLLLIGFGITSVPSLLAKVMTVEIENPVPVQFDHLSAALSLAMMGAKPGTVTSKPEFSSKTSIALVLDRFQTCPNYRLKEITMSLVQHLHRLILEADITIEEWNFAINFLTRVGQKCSDERQEVVMLSDVLGVEALVEDMQFRKNTDVSGGNVTPGSLLGPFHIPSKLCWNSF